ncbi:Solute carrier family 25 member 48, partial [Struthio camelus australis]
GAASVVVGHPLDTVKTRLQAGQGYGNTLNCVLTVYRNESVNVFWCFGKVPLFCVIFTSREKHALIFICSACAKGWLPETRAAQVRVAGRIDKPGFTSLGAARLSSAGSVPGTFAGMLQLAATNIKLKPPVPGFPVYRGPIHCFRTVLQKDGIAGIYRGAGATLLRDVPGYCLYFIPYAFFCGWITPDGCLSPNPSSVWLAGGVAGAISWGTATPMDVVKSRLQADGVHSNKYKGTFDCILQSYQSEGLKVFFRGITVNAVRGFPMSSAMFLGYELSLKAMKRDQTETNP